MDNHQIYRKLTYNIQTQITKFKEKKISEDQFNQRLILNLSSLCFFLKDREKRKKNQSNNKTEILNQTILDVFVPYSKLTSILKNKIDEINAIEEEGILDNIEELDNPLLDLTLDNKNNNNNDHFQLNESEIYINPTNTDKYLMDDSQSVNMSFFSKPIESPVSIISNPALNQNKSKEAKNIRDTTHRGTSTKISNLPTSISGGSDQSSSGLKSNSSEIKEAMDEFKLTISEKVIYDAVKATNIDFLRGCYYVYDKMKPEDPNEIDNLKAFYLNQFKTFLLNLGITEKKMYENCIRSIIYNQKPLAFSDFLECCLQIIYLDYEHSYLKYKCNIFILIFSSTSFNH